MLFEYMACTCKQYLYISRHDKSEEKHAWDWSETSDSKGWVVFMACMTLILTPSPTRSILQRNFSWLRKRKTKIPGVLNLTPPSFIPLTSTLMTYLVWNRKQHLNASPAAYQPGGSTTNHRLVDTSRARLKSRWFAQPITVQEESSNNTSVTINMKHTIH